ISFHLHTTIPRPLLHSVRTWVFLLLPPLSSLLFFFFNYTSTTEIYTLSLHDALPILVDQRHPVFSAVSHLGAAQKEVLQHNCVRSEEHTSELQSLTNIVCRLLLEKKK